MTDFQDKLGEILKTCRDWKYDFGSPGAYAHLADIKRAEGKALLQAQQSITEAVLAELGLAYDKQYVRTMFN